MKQFVYNLIRDDDDNDLLANIFDFSIISLIITNLILIILDTFNLPLWYTTISSFIENFSLVIFTLEYFARFWVSDLLYPKLGPLVSRIKYTFSFMALIDLISILPFYIPFFIPIDLRILRAFRMIRLLRLLKINRYTSALKTFSVVLVNKKGQLVSSLILVSLLMLISSVLMYNLESGVQPDVFVNAFSGLWWAVATLTTVGYGDIYPVTIGGKLVAGVIAILGIGFVALPTGIISAGFIELIETDKIKNVDRHKKSYAKRRNRRPKRNRF